MDFFLALMQRPDYKLYELIKSKSWFTDLLVFRQALLSSWERFLFAARCRCDEQLFVIDVKMFVGRLFSVHRFVCRSFHGVYRFLARPLLILLLSLWSSSID